MPWLVNGDSEGVKAALKRLGDHLPVVMPTETVYGLAAPTHDATALDRIYTLKGRPVGNPLIAHVTNAIMARSIVTDWGDRAEALAAAMWPGPLTLILPKRADVPDVATGGLKTIAVRAPAHSIAQALITAVGEPLSAPSANRSGNVSPTCAAHVMDDYQTLDAAHNLLVLDGGPCEVGLESTVLSLVEPQPKLLRPGTVSCDQLEAIIGPVKDAVSLTQGASPGSSPRHYAPQTKVQLIDEATWTPSSMRLVANVVFIAASDVALPPGVTAIAMPSDAASAAASLYALLREADALAHKVGAGSIVIIAPPDEPQWRAVRDRLQRAAAIG